MNKRSPAFGGALPLFSSHFGSSFSCILHGFDRLRLRGTLRQLYCPRVMESYLSASHTLLKDFAPFVERFTRSIKAATEAFAREWQRPLLFVSSSQRSKEQIAREIAQKDHIREGLIAVLTAVEPCMSYSLVGNRGTGHIELKLQNRKCLHFYFYLEHPVLGFMHLRLQSWFPFQINLCINGHHWLATQLDKEGISYRKRENALVWVEDPARAQQLLDAQVHFGWEQALNELVALLHPTHASLISVPLPLRYYWSISDSEYASDVLFHEPEELARIYPRFVSHAVRTFGCGDVMRFLGRKVPSSGEVPEGFGGEIISDLKRRKEGVRIKHWLNGNTLKCYDKQGSVLRVETTIVHPEEFKVYRRLAGQPDSHHQWRELRRSVADSYRRAQVSRAANERYLEALAVTCQSQSLFEATRQVCRPLRWRKRRSRALQPLGEGDARLLETVHRGEFLLKGFRVRDLVEPLGLKLGRGASQQEKRRVHAAVGRRIRLLRAHRLVRRMGSSHRYVVTVKGHQVITLLLAAFHTNIDRLSSLAAA